MQRFIAAGLTALLCAGAAVATAGPAAAAEDRSLQTVSINADSTGVHYSKVRVHEGVVRFELTPTTDPIGVTLLQPHPGVTLAKVLADAAEEYDPATAAASTRDLTRDAFIHGLADAVPGAPLSATVSLEEGTYYVVGSTSDAPPTAAAATKFEVVKASHSDSKLGLAHQATVAMTSADRFILRGALPAQGSVLVKNTSDTIHFMFLVPVVPGTTDAQVQAYFDSGSEDAPAFALNGPTASTDLLTPGKQVVLGYSLPKGTYVMLCFIADDQTGMPHAAMGMHKVVTLG